MKDRPPQPLRLEQDDAERLIRAVEDGTLNATDRKRVAGLTRMVLWLQTTLLETRIGLSRLRRVLFGAKTEKRSRTTKSDDGNDGNSPSGKESDQGAPDSDATGQDERGQSSATDSGEDAGDKPSADDPPKTTQPRGHGRPGAAAYTGAETVFRPHGDYRAGDECPWCRAGRLYRMKTPMIRLRFQGQPLALVTRYETVQVFDGLCQSGAIA